MYASYAHFCIEVLRLATALVQVFYQMPGTTGRRCGPVCQPKYAPVELQIGFHIRRILLSNLTRAGLTVSRRFSPVPITATAYFQLYSFRFYCSDFLPACHEYVLSLFFHQKVE
ncbi:hypothetical protein DUQ60_22565 [Salmonella enterica subsp. enterica]|uniref:Uncharacterized protein n=2 Tax=Salmonella enterica subsp. enterica serovar Lattenkamp TaxID=2564671 RepID=A0A5W2LZB9_SALET|nr:hypothetical protein [Salmonella enterica subsp. enterica serovar Lattenkamp]EAQ8610398.1 hypothetical protein [Salmonella enterica]ECJ3925140.1 hypothetical protein [Salmonella enterica subsp. enterica]EAR5593761.1 hypothetical protein [Salmonella enterica]EBK5134215.1 hypothetical protein [Salmonella enterica]